MAKYLFRIVSASFRKSLILLISAAALLVVLWTDPGGSNALSLHFLDVGQGDSELVVLPGGATMLIDGGPANGLLHNALGTVLPFSRRSIDVVLLSHPQTDHFGGLIEVFRRYRVGALVHSGYRGDGVAAEAFWDAVQESGTDSIAVRKGSRIRYGESSATVLSPERSNSKANANDDSVALLVQSNGASLFLAGDAGGKREEEIGTTAGFVDVLKVSHHGSKFSSTAQFLKTIQPRIAVIEVGKNGYGHPAPETMRRLADSGAVVLDTKTYGTVSLTIRNGEISIFTESGRDAERQAP